MANPGLPTSVSHNLSVENLSRLFDSILIRLSNTANSNRVAMAAGAVGDDAIKSLWDVFAKGEADIDEIRRTPDFQDNYARHRGLAYTFNCTDDVNAANDRIINLPTNHKIKVDHRVDFKIREGALPGGLAEGTNYWVRTIDSANGFITLTTTEGGATDINLTNGTGIAEMIVNIKPDLSALRTDIDQVLDEIELNLTQRGTTYDRPNWAHTASTRSTVETATLRTLLQDVEDLIDLTEA